MKKILFILGSALLHKMLIPSEGTARPVAAFPARGKINAPYLLGLAKSYSLIVWAALFATLFLFGGLMATIFSIAQSFDLTGSFVPGAVFVTALTVSVLSVVALGLCYSAFRKKAPNPDLLYIFEEAPVQRSWPDLEALRIAQPLLMAAWKAWQSRRASEPQSARPSSGTKAGEPPYQQPRAS